MINENNLKAQFRNVDGIVVKFDDTLTDLLSHKEALDYCRILGLGWRLPTATDLEIMYEKRDFVKLSRELDGGSPYWSGRAKDINYAYCVRMNSQCSETMERPVPNTNKLRVVFVYGGINKND